MSIPCFLSPNSLCFQTSHSSINWAFPTFPSIILELWPQAPLPSNFATIQPFLCPNSRVFRAVLRPLRACAGCQRGLVSPGHVATQWTWLFHRWGLDPYQMCFATQKVLFRLLAVLVSSSNARNNGNHALLRHLQWLEPVILPYFPTLVCVLSQVLWS